MMRLIATQRFPYDNKALKVGDPFDASDKDAQMLIGFGKARAGNAAENSSEQNTQSPRKKRQYRRRDMEAENSADLISNDGQG